MTPVIVDTTLNRLYLSPEPDLKVQTTAGQSFSLPLGAPTNDYGHNVDIEVDLGRAVFIMIDDKISSLFYPANKTTQSDIGTYIIVLKLSCASLN